MQLLYTVVNVHGHLNVVTERPPGSSSTGSFFGLFQALRSRIDDTLFGRLPWNHLGGTLQLALYLLRNKKGRMCIEPHLTRGYAVSLVRTLLRLVELDDERMIKEASQAQAPSSSPCAWSSWLSPLFVLLLELLHAPPSSSDTLFARVNGQKSMAASTPLERASSERGPGPGLSVDDMGPQDLEDLTREVIDRVGIDPEETSLLPEVVWEEIFEMVVHVLHRSSSTSSSSPARDGVMTGVSVPSPCPSDVKPAAGGTYPPASASPCLLDPHSCQGLLIVLRLLLIKQSLASKFVSVGGLSSFLHLPATCHSQDSAHMLTLIVQRCLESPYELRQQMVESLRTLFKTAGTPSDTRAGEQKLSFPIFLNFAAPYLVRSPQDFMAVVVAAVRIVRLTTGPSSQEPSNTTPGSSEPSIAITAQGNAAIAAAVSLAAALGIVAPAAAAATATPSAVSTPTHLHPHDLSSPGEIHVALHKKDTLERRLLSMERGLAAHHIEANGRCTVVLDTLIRHFLEINDASASSPSPGTGAGAGDSKDRLGGEADPTPTSIPASTPASTPTGLHRPGSRLLLLFTRADVIETMADCAIELFGFPAALGR